ncbi:hypothetical protein [Pseudomonas sp. 13B_2.1_Bac1]|uniref:hypothetical protein n=1 Tax=Pseudomonas sp. 13B_2.1_Bac1 TaxID=2971624 RepID=UPI0021C6E21C|nr:hypothetical protein [Pseudomonas sp. 13B_2.1_Bac1]
MISSLNHSLNMPIASVAQQDEVTRSRNKRSIEQTHEHASDGPAANDRRRSTGTLDSLGGGRLL